MSIFSEVRERARAVFRRGAAEREMDEEMQFHLEKEAERLMRSEGLDRTEAGRRARLRFGGVERFREEVREARGTRRLEEMAQDVRYAMRSMRRAPAFATAAVLTLAIGVGANAAVFGMVSATLLRPLPFPEPDRLVSLYQRQDGSEVVPRPTPWSYPEFRAVRASLSSLTDAAAYYPGEVNLSGTGADPARVRAEMVSATYFRALNVRPVLGRTFSPQEDSLPGTHPVAVLGHRVWQAELGADPGAVGRQVLLNGVPLTVIGVLPAGFHGLTGEGEVWITHAMAPQVYFPEHLTTGERFLNVVARLEPGVSLQRAAAEASSVATAVAAAVRREIGADEDDAQFRARLLPLEEARRDPATVRAQLVLAGAVFFVLLIAAVNLSGLLLARAVGRTREVAVRTALGATRSRLLRQAMAESGSIGLLGGALGALIAAWSVRALSTFAPERLGGAGARFSGLRLDAFSTPEADWRVVLFAGALAVAAGLIAGLLPALRSTRVELTGSLKSGARGSTAEVGSLRRPTVLSGIAVAQVTFALVLLVSAGLLLEAFHRLRSIDTGLDAAAVVTFRLNPPEAEYGGAAAAPLLERVLEHVAALPGVESATVGRCLPGTGCSSTSLFRPEQRGAEPAPEVRRHYVGPDHFRTLGIPVLRGRGLTPEDRAGRVRVAVVNETAARRFWPGEDPIGKQVWFGSGEGFASPDSMTTIVGIVGDVRYGAPGEEMEADFYTSYLQYVLPATMVMIRASGDPAALAPALRRAVAEVDPNLPIHDVRTVTDVGDQALAEERFATAALGIFAGIGLFLAALGVYGVMAYSVAQRRREIGIRLALGATASTVLKQVVGQGTALAAVGVGVGVLISLGLAGVLSSLSPAIGSANPLILAGGALVLLAVAVMTCYLPARSAARVDPASALLE